MLRCRAEWCDLADIPGFFFRSGTGSFATEESSILGFGKAKGVVLQPQAPGIRARKLIIQSIIELANLECC